MFLFHVLIVLSTAHNGPVDSPASQAAEIKRLSAELARLRLEIMDFSKQLQETKHATSAMRKATAGSTTLPTRVIPMQLYVTDATGRALDGSVDLTFRLYATPTGGVPIGSPLMLSSVTVSNGLTNVLLDAEAFGDISFDVPLYVGMSIEGAPELTPRQQVWPAIYAIDAGHAALAERAFAAEGLLVPGTRDPALTVTADGKIGIGDTDPAATVSIAGPGGHADEIDLDVAGVIYSGNIVFSSRSMTTVDMASGADLSFDQLADTTNAFDGTTFTAPMPGLYLVLGNVTFDPDGDVTVTYCRIVQRRRGKPIATSAARNDSNGTLGNTGTHFTLSMSGIFLVETGDTFRMDVSFSGSPRPLELLAQDRNFSGFLIARLPDSN